jgi:hypothetical protein
MTMGDGGATQTGKGKVVGFGSFFLLPPSFCFDLRVEEDTVEIYSKKARKRHSSGSHKTSV